MSDPARPQHIDFSGFEAALRRQAAEREAPHRSPPIPSAIAAASRLTEVELTWIEKKLEHWIRFGRIAHDRILTRRTRVVSFRPGAIFTFVRWSANDYGTITSRIDVLRAVDAGEPYTTLPFVRPGGDILLHIESWPKVSQVLAAIDAVEAAGVDPCDAASDHWRHVHNRIAAGHEPRPYTMERHRAWLKRREIEG
ncbi:MULTISPECIES: DUF2840 domain-containing protein [Pseudomonadota]|uniref:DUF2840 domain-containing protein n=1 Tax=Pseudomonadota TaxID=1224 RepID=UPI0012BB1F50|nr:MULTISPECIES: DUF2840 domain-containing protein [Pseudomonadota]MCE4544728.1 DUF2840 domain-containing protein [Caballeronia sp. PC1]MCE4545067.1 DUF2840 domain-containing protein [Caballeronia sp. PC1]MCE4570488.1 DUF2840 domain-containing protein [Caballeronia sp. CLC5]QGP77725.1 DUF2840 domain-containing protein [Sphingobium sp. CAP-1]QKR98485.1 DUF2840 domain-containing protein [Sphingomonas sp. CL5.1]|tara:strand:+ start:6309 stop:6896 length:588 start_codon:yes stop_codon:yes gene_type:complete